MTTPTTPPTAPLPSILTSQLNESLEYGDPSRFGINWLIAGDPCSGKTHTCGTARQPIYIQSFDKQGSELAHIRQLVTEGKCIINRECEHDDPTRPRALTLFQKNFNALLKAGAFAHIGTYVIDSLTFLAEAMFNEILSKAGRAGANPQIQDYGDFNRNLLRIIDACCALPCDFVLTSHIAHDRDEITNSAITSVLITGKKLPPMIPRYFSEFLVSDVVQSTDKGPMYRLLTQPYKRYMARTRIGSGIFSTHETPDLMYLREKAGYGVQHLPPIATPTVEKGGEK